MMVTVIQGEVTKAWAKLVTAGLNTKGEIKNCKQ